MIGVFDSGAGGLTVLKEIREILPDYDTIYLGDTARYPYGSQSAKMIQRYAKEDADFLINRGAKVIVIACNSASAAAGEMLSSELQIPLFNVIQAAIEEAVKVTKSKRIGIIGTKATINSGVHEMLLKKLIPNSLVVAKATPLLVPIVEERWWRHPETMRIIRRYLRPLKNAHLDVLILGCTHYPMLEKLIQRVMGPKVKLINSAKSTAEAMKEFFTENKEVEKKMSKKGKQIYCITSDAQHFEETAEWWLGRRVKAEEVKLQE